MHLFLCADPVLNGDPAVKRLSTYACAGRHLAARLPSGERVGCDAKFARQLLAADLVRQQVQRFMWRFKVGLCHGCSIFLMPLSRGQGQRSRLRGAEYRRKVELKPTYQFRPLFHWDSRRFGLVVGACPRP